MAYQFTQTGAQIQSILDQVPTNTSDIASLNATLTQFINEFSGTVITPGIRSGRASNLTGGYIKIGKLVFITLSFVSNGGNLMAYLEGLPVPSITAAPLFATQTGYSTQLTAVALNDGSIAVSAHTNGNTIFISGVYVAS